MNFKMLILTWYRIISSHDIPTLIDLQMSLPVLKPNLHSLDKAFVSSRISLETLRLNFETVPKNQAK